MTRFAKMTHEHSYSSGLSLSNCNTVTARASCNTGGPTLAGKGGKRHKIAVQADKAGREMGRKLAHSALRKANCRFNPYRREFMMISTPWRSNEQSDADEEQQEEDDRMDEEDDEEEALEREKEEDENDEEDEDIHSDDMHLLTGRHVASLT